MQIKWLGHSSFLIKNSLGKRILIDPFNSEIGYSSFEGNIDIITVSHNHFDHFCINDSWNNCNILTNIGEYSFSFCNIKGVLSYHDKKKGTLRGENIIFIYDLEGLRLCHLGDLGHELSSETINNLCETIDVLFIPIGGHYTINGTEASNVCKSLKPKLIMPMHYKTPFLSIQLNGPEEFILSMDTVIKIHSNTFCLNKDDLYKPMSVILLDF